MTAIELITAAEMAEATEKASDAATKALHAAKEAYGKTCAKYHVGDLVRDRRETVHRIDSVYVEVDLADHDAPIDVRYSTVVQKKKGGDKRRATFGYVSDVSSWLREAQVIGRA